jgi:tetratricopeptide (TPR) repeat protein
MIWSITCFPRFSAGKDHPPLRSLGELYFELKQYDKAAAAYAVAVKLDPSNAAAQHRLGWLLSELGKFNEAIGPLKIALQLQPADLDTYSELVGVLVDPKAEGVTVERQILTNWEPHAKVTLPQTVTKAKALLRGFDFGATAFPFLNEQPRDESALRQQKPNRAEEVGLVANPVLRACDRTLTERDRRNPNRHQEKGQHLHHRCTSSRRAAGIHAALYSCGATFTTWRARYFSVKARRHPWHNTCRAGISHPHWRSP